MREITEIIVHCSATPEGKEFSAWDINRWHKAKGWDGIGYHYVIKIDGTIEIGRPRETVGAHCVGHNQHSIGVCYIGGLAADGKTPKDTRTPEQKKSLRYILECIKMSYPAAVICGHNEFAPKACPCFNARKEYADI